MNAISYKAPINRAILRWARESLSIGIDKAAKTAAVKNEVYQQWEEGEALPTISKLRNLANLYKRPLAVFFMPQIPEESPLPKDFRPGPIGLDYPLSRKSILAIRKAGWYQSVARDLMKELAYPVQPPQKIDFQTQSMENIAREIRQLDLDVQLSWETNWEALKNWRQYLEDQGIFVFQMSMPVSEVRGFSLLRQDYPPVIVINSKDSRNGRIFTLFHEYGHILLNQSGICIPEEIEYRSKVPDQTEHLCNEFAGNFLVPSQQLLKFAAESPQANLFDLINDLSKKFVVSQFVILRRLYALKKIDLRSYQRAFGELQKRVKLPGDSGGDFYRNQFAEKGRKFIGLVMEAESGNTITTSRALDILGIQLKHYPRLTDMLFH
jgi:Zn-dependent peptidase ImmA (M78 family)